ncbi:RNA polymerase III subunit C82 [Microbotryomycetes sp. JL201]|nr:RNA polymerase III subunit C82 [Microbotryomycetes sp. JL201]
MSPPLKDKARLVHHVVLQHFGQATAEVTALLLARGALSLPQLARLTTLPLPTIHSCLLTLSIHCLLYHSETEVAGRLVEVYEINTRNVLGRTRGALYSQMAKDRQDLPSFDAVVDALWREGMLRRDEIMGIVVEDMRKNGWTPHANGTTATTATMSSTKGKAKATAQDDIDDDTLYVEAERMLRRAFNESFIIVVTPGSQLDPSSLAIKWEDELKLKITNIPSAKQLKEVQQSLNEKQTEWDLTEFLTARGRTEKDPKRKRLRDDETEFDLPELPEHAFFTINPDRFNIQWRREILVSYVRDRYNEAIAKVFEQVLIVSEDSIETMRDDRSRAISRLEIATRWRALPEPKPSLQDVFGKTPLLSGFDPKTLRTTEIIGEICSLLSGIGGGALPGDAVLREIGEGQGARWQVNYRALCSKVKTATIHAIISGKYGDVALRCWKILDLKGNLDEKHLARLAFLSAKDAREVVGRLSAACLIEQQDVPRSADHAPSRTFYLYSVNPRNSLTTLLDRQYKALSNLAAQTIHHLKLNHSLIDKRNRPDVRANPSLLTARDKVQLKTLDDTIEALTVEQLRLDKQVFILSEFSDQKYL